MAVKKREFDISEFAESATYSNLLTNEFTKEAFDDVFRRINEQFDVPVESKP